MTLFARFMAGLGLMVFLSICHAAGDDGELTFIAPEIPGLIVPGDSYENPKGPGYDLFSELMKQLPFKSRIIVVPMARAPFMLSDRSLNCELAHRRTPENQGKFKWAGVIARAKLNIYGAPDSTIKATTLDDLKGQVIGVTHGSYLFQILSAKGMKIDESQDDESNIKKMLHGRYQFIAASDVVYETIAKAKNIKLKLILSLESIEYEIACTPVVPDEKVNQLRDLVERWRLDGRLKTFGL